MADERKVKKREAGNERYGLVKQRKHHTEFISAAIVYIAALSNPTHSEISDINLFISCASDLILDQQPYWEYDFIWFFPVKLKIVFLGK